MVSSRRYRPHGTNSSPAIAVTRQKSSSVARWKFAGALLRTLGVDHNPEDALAGGLNQIQQTLTQWGVNPDSYVLVDGSG